MIELGSARILVTNDDGIGAPGIKVLERIARSLSKDVTTIAPELEQSAAGHSLTLRRPLRIRKEGRRRWSVDGTPTDTVLLGIRQVMEKKPPQLVLSGVNRGGNLGEDVTYSGTVAAAMEATLLGVPAIALSQELRARHDIPWKTAEVHGPEVIRRLCGAGWPPMVVINVNFPGCAPEEVAGIRVARMGKRKIGEQLGQRVDLRGEHYYWIGTMRKEQPTQPGTDLAAIAERYIAVTPLHIDMTHGATAAALERVMA